MSRAILAGCLVLVHGLAAGSLAQQSGVDLAKLAGWDIVIADDAIPSEIHAAEEFQSFLAQASGIQLPIVTTADRPDRHVLIGASPMLADAGLQVDVAAMGPEQLRIVVRDGLIAIVGGRPRGTLYGVYTFLEDYLGVRFLTADHTHVPRLAPSAVIASSWTSSVTASPSGEYAAMYKPYHLIGLELGVTVASVGLRGEATGSARDWRADVVATAHKAEPAMPNRVSLPSMLPPGLTGVGAWVTPWVVDSFRRALCIVMSLGKQ